MKILIATGIFPPEIGGPATYAGLLAEELKKRNDEVVVLPFRDVRQLPKLFRHVAYFFKVLKLSRGVDVIFTQDPVSTGIPVVFAAMITRTKVVMRVAGDYAWEQARQRYGVTESVEDFQTKKYSFAVELIRTAQRFATRRADAVIVPSRYFASIVSTWPGLRDKVTTIYNGIDLSFVPDSEEKYTDKTIISAGRLVKGKGFETLIKAAVQMPYWKVLIAGDGPEEQNLKKVAETEKVADRVTFLGRLSRQELFAHISKSHVFALLSSFETFSFQIVEAMHIGTPVITTARGALPELVESGKNGILVEPDDIQGFVAAAEKIGSDNLYAHSLADAAKLKSATFSIVNTMDRLYAVFQKVISS